MPGVVTGSSGLCVASPSAVTMSDQGVTRKLMNPSSELQFFNLVRQLVDNSTDDSRIKTLKNLSSMRNLQLSPKGFNQFRQECNDSLKNTMESLMLQQNKLWSTIWVFIVEQMGQELHVDNKFLNSMLSILEQGMKRKDTVSMKWSLSCWQVLIDNFALGQKMISTPRRVTLLTIPLKAKNVKEISVLEQKFKLWWHLLVSLREFVDMHTETVTKPFLLFTFGPFEQGESHLLSKFPNASTHALDFLTSFVATGVVDKELNALDLRFKSSRPLINDSKVFLCLAETIIKCTEILFKQPYDMMSREFRVLLSAIIVRISTLCRDNSSFGGDMLAMFLNMLKNTLFGLIVLNRRYQDLLLHATETAIDVLPATLMDTKLKNLNHVTPRDFLFGLLCEKELLLLQATPNISKTDERQSIVLGKLLITPGALVAHPDRLANAKVLVNTLVELQDLSQGEAARKCLHLWEQCSKFLCKIPKESPNEQCNQITQKILWSMIVMPFKLTLIKGTADCLSSAAAESSMVKALKSLFFLYSEVEHLSLTMVASRQAGKPLPKKESPLQKFYNTLSNLLTQDKYPAMTCQVLIKVISKFVSVRSNASYTKLFGKSSDREAEMAELKLLGKFTALLISLAADTPQQTGKMCSYVAKGLENVVLLVSSAEATVEAINIFYELLTKTPLSFWPNNRMEVTDPWDSLVTPFSKIWLQKVELTSRLPLLNSVKAKIEELTEHKDIKVCNTAREMLSRYSRHENESSSSSSDTPVNTPTNNRLTQSRKRSFMMTQSSPVVNQVKSPGQTISPSRPALEDLDSQDFVKIPSQTKMKKPLTPHQREVKKRRREDIPALYQGLSQDTQQSQDTQDDLLIIEFTKLPLTVTAPVWNEDAMDIDLVSNNKSKSDENKSLNSQEDPEPITIDDEKELKKPADSQDIEIIENSQNYSTMPAVQPEARPDIECLHTVRSRNRQGVLLPPTQKPSKDIEIVSVKDSAPVNKRKSLPPMRGAGLKGRAAQMVGLATSKDSDAETKPADISLPLMVMSSLMAKSSAKPDESVNSNDKSPKTKTSPIASVTPLSSHKKRSNLKNTETPSPMRSKRVSFAEPIVSGRQDSPNILQDIQVYNNYYKQSPNTKKKMKASRKLLMAPKDGFQIIKEHSKAQCSLETKLTAETEGLIEPNLIDCMIPVSEIADKLVSPMHVRHLLTTMDEKNIKTVRDLNKLSETDIADLPIKEPKWASLKTLLKLLKDADNSDDEQEKDVTTEIETLPSTQPDTLPSIATVTTHADTIQVIEDVITSPENDSPTEPKENPTSSDIEGTDEPMELPQSQEDPDNETSQETDKDSPIIVESSLEPQPEAVTSIKDTQEATNITIPDTQDAAELRHASPLPVKILSAEETFAAMLPSDKEKLRRMILAETQSQELMDTLITRKENLLSNKSLSELVDEIKHRSCTPEVYKLLAASDSDLQTFIGNNADVAQLLQNRSEEEIVAALTTFSKHNRQTSVAVCNKFLGQLKNKHLADIFSNLEDKVYKALPKSMVENKIKNDLMLCKEILESTDTSDIVANLTERCSKGGASFTPSQASTLYSQIKSHVTGADSVQEIFHKLQLKLDDGLEGNLKTEFQSRPQLRKVALDSSEQEEILTQLTLDTQDQQIKLCAKLNNDDMLAMASAKLLGQQNLIITAKMLRSLEQLALYLNNESLFSVMKRKDLSEEAKRTAVQLLAENVDLPKLLTEQQVKSLVDGLIDDPEERSNIAAEVVSKSKEGELLLAVGGVKLISLMTLGVLNGDVKAVDSIQKIFCNTDTVAAACQIIKDGASDSQIGMVKEAIPKQVLASWITDIIMK